MGKESLLEKTGGVAENPSQVAKEEILDQKVNPEVSTSLFDEEITDAELRGEDKPAEETKVKPEEKPASEKSGTEDSSGEKAKLEAEAAKEKEAEKAAAPKNPPEGFVPLKALHEERSTRQKLQAENEELRDALENQDDGEQEYTPKSTLDGDFKVLTEEEYETLNSEDPVAAMQYRIDFKEYKTAQDQQEAKEVAIQDSIKSGFSRVIEKLPEIAEDDNTVAEDIEVYAEKHGIDSKVFLDMANPATMIVDQNGTFRPLGTDAADFILLLHETMTSEAGMKESLEADIRKEVEAELVEKFKSKESNFTSLEDAPLSSESLEGGLTELTEDSFRGLSEKETEEALRGS